MRLTSGPLCALFVASCAHASPAPEIGPSGALPWRQDFAIWYGPDESASKPWRTGPRLQGRFHSAEFPDDIEVLFHNPERTDKLQNEIMWVTVFAYDPASDLFLGVLINEPYALKTVADKDNVVFRVYPGMPYPVALAEGGRYDAPGWPVVKPGSFDAALLAGLRHYRHGNYGHNQPEMKKCADALRPALKQPPGGVPPRHLQLAYFVLGRCLAEQYETREALANFAKAVELDPSDCHARLSLTAEHSVMAFKDDVQAPEGEAFWEQKYLDAIAETRRRCPPDDTKILDIIFAEGKKAAEQSNDPRSAKLARVGAGVFRDKSR